MSTTDQQTKQGRILTGMRPTGPLHLGHYLGALERWLELQGSGRYELFFLIADLQALGDHGRDLARIRGAVETVALDWLSVGLDPEGAAFVLQSAVPEHTELAFYLATFTPLSELRHNPTLKHEIEQLDARKETVTVGFYTYPVSQAADILLPRADLVPVGADQVPHVELTRRVARRYNELYAPLFPEPEALVGRVGRLAGTDGNAKMGKSLGNAIYLTDDDATVSVKVRRMVTDSTGTHPRLRDSDPGIVEDNPVFDYLRAFDPDQAEVDDVAERYRQGRVSDKAVKDRLTAVLTAFLDPIRERRSAFSARPAIVREVLATGSARERRLAAETMERVRDRMAASIG